MNRVKLLVLLIYIVKLSLLISLPIDVIQIRPIVYLLIILLLKILLRIFLVLPG